MEVERAVTSLDAADLNTTVCSAAADETRDDYSSTTVGFLR